MIDMEKIRKQAKQIMDDFIRALNKTEGLKNEFGQERKSFTREKAKSEKDTDFRKRMFKNAPKKRDDFIVMEKKNW